MTRNTTDSIVTDDGTHIGYKVPAEEADVARVLFSVEWQGRSPFYWITLATGDVVLAVYPQGDLFETLLQEGTFE